jgi:hypothetical protein
VAWQDKLEKAKKSQQPEEVLNKLRKQVNTALNRSDSLSVAFLSVVGLEDQQRGAH